MKITTKSASTLIVFLTIILMLLSASCHKSQNPIETLPPETVSSDENLFNLGQQYIKKDMEKEFYS